jgi:hypothetical protein
MPLLDHFREPLRPRRHWTSFHSAWATFIASDLNRQLPEDYVAEPNAKFNIEIDVATFRDSAVPESMTSVWQPPAPTMTVAFTAITDIVEVQIIHFSGGPNLVGAIEIVSPANKDREATRDAFVNKCAGYLQEGIGLIVIDIVTERKANLHNQILSRVSALGETWTADLYVVSYHPVQREPKKLGRAQEVLEKSLEIWPYELMVGSPLPTLPMCLKGGVSLPLDLDAIYMRTCQESRIPVNGK